MSGRDIPRSFGITSKYRYLGFVEILKIEFHTLPCFLEPTVNTVMGEGVQQSRIHVNFYFLLRDTGAKTHIKKSDCEGSPTNNKS